MPMSWDKKKYRLTDFAYYRYLFSPQIEGFLDQSDMLVELTKSCLGYLMEDHHEPDLSDTDTEKAIVMGLYPLHGYATRTWYELVEGALALPKCDGLLDILERFSRARLKEDSEEVEEPAPANIEPHIEMLKREKPTVYMLLRRVSQFDHLCQSSDFNMDNGECQIAYVWELSAESLDSDHLSSLEARWRPMNPINTSGLVSRIHNTFDRLLRNSNAHPNHNHCSYSSLQEIYGSRMFKCPYLGCSMRHQGFETHSLRRSHMAHHTRPWKCDVPGCEYVETGFLSRRMRDDHLNHFHQPEQAGSNSLDDISSKIKANCNSNDTMAIFLDLVRADHTEGLKFSHHRFDSLWTDAQMKVLEVAASCSSPSTLGVVWEKWKEVNAEEHVKAEERIKTARRRERLRTEIPKFMALNLLNHACEWGNMEVIQWLLETNQTRMADDDTDYPNFRLSGGMFPVDAWDTILSSVLKSDSEDVFQTLLPELVREFTTARTGSSLSPAAGAMSLVCIKACGRQENRVARLISLWKRINVVIGSKSTEYTGAKGSQFRGKHEDQYIKTLGMGLCYVAESCCSVDLAKELLSYGTDINYNGSYSRISAYRTPLHRALRKSSPGTAEMARFLLYRGADPDRTTSRAGDKWIKDEVGAVEISKWLGVTWDELVHKVKEDREAGICPPEYL